MKKFFGAKKKIGALVLTASFLCGVTPSFADTIVYTPTDSTVKEQEEYIQTQGYKLVKPVTSVDYYDYSYTESGVDWGPGAVAIEPGTTRITTYKYPVSGNTYLVEKKSAPVAMTVWNTSMYIAGKLAKTFGGFVLDGVNLAFDSIDKNAGATVHTYQSYRYTEKNAQVYTNSKSWSTKYQAEREEVYKHAFNSWASTKYNTTRTKTVDYVPENGYSAHITRNSPNYLNNKVLANRAWTNWYKGYNYYKTPEYY